VAISSDGGDSKWIGSDLTLHCVPFTATTARLPLQMFDRSASLWIPYRRPGRLSVGDKDEERGPYFQKE
jgi:hypothetical protein